MIFEAFPIGSFIQHALDLHAHHLGLTEVWYAPKDGGMPTITVTPSPQDTPPPPLPPSPRVHHTPHLKGTVNTPAGKPMNPEHPKLHLAADAAPDNPPDMLPLPGSLEDLISSDPGSAIGMVNGELDTVTGVNSYVLNNHLIVEPDVHRSYDGAFDAVETSGPRLTHELNTLDRDIASHRPQSVIDADRARVKAAFDQYESDYDRYRSIVHDIFLGRRA
jgi:hypothetical protein